MNEKAIERLMRILSRINEGRVVKVFPDGTSLRQGPSEIELDLAEVIGVLIDLLEAQHDG